MGLGRGLRTTPAALAVFTALSTVLAIVATLAPSQALAASAGAGQQVQVVLALRSADPTALHALAAEPLRDRLVVDGAGRQRRAMAAEPPVAVVDLGQHRLHVARRIGQRLERLHPVAEVPRLVHERVTGDDLGVL